MTFFFNLMTQIFKTMFLRFTMVPPFLTQKKGTLKDIKVSLCETEEEYLEAHRLIYQCYLDKKLTQENPSQIRCTLHSFFPHTRIIIAKNKDNKVIGTVSVIRDNLLGLPAEKEFHAEINQLRSSGVRELVEVSALSVDKAWRNLGHDMLFLMQKYIYYICRDHLNVTTKVIVVHPNAQVFYSAFWLFKPLGKTIAYKFVQGALGRFMYLDFRQNFQQKHRWAFFFRKKSFSYYLFNVNDPRMILKPFREDKLNIVEKGIGLSLLKESRFDFSTLSQRELDYLVSSLNLDKRDLADLGISLDRRVIPYRFMQNLKAKVIIRDRFYDLVIKNISENGAFLQCDLEAMSLGDEGIIHLYLNQSFFNSSFIVRWVNTGVNPRLPAGFGIEFKSSKIEIFNPTTKGFPVRKVA